MVKKKQAFQDVCFCSLQESLLRYCFCHPDIFITPVGINWWGKSEGILQAFYHEPDEEVHCILLYTSLYILLYTSLYILLYTSLYFFILLYTSLYFFILLYTSLYCCCYCYCCCYYYYYCYSSYYYYYYYYYYSPCCCCCHFCSELYRTNVVLLIWIPLFTDKKAVRFEIAQTATTLYLSKMVKFFERITGSFDSSSRPLILVLHGVSLQSPPQTKRGGPWGSLGSVVRRGLLKFFFFQVHNVRRAEATCQINIYKPTLFNECLPAIAFQFA